MTSVSSVKPNVCYETITTKSTFAVKWIINSSYKKYNMIYDDLESPAFVCGIYSFYLTYNALVADELNVFIWKKYDFYENHDLYCKIIVYTMNGEYIEDHFILVQNVDVMKTIYNIKFKHRLINDNFQILCTIEWLRGVDTVSDVPAFTSNIEGVNSTELIEDFAKLFENKFLSDFTIKTEEKEFHVHKCVLAIRSKVFAAMFAHDLQENKTNCMDILDINVDAVQEMLRFIYTGKCENLNNVCIDLFILSDIYDLKSLKSQCEVYICNNFIIENAVKTLLLAERYNISYLKEKIIHFINMNKENVAKTIDWEHINSNLLTELYLKEI